MRNWIAVAIAVVLGLLAVFLGNTYFSGFEAKQEQIAEQQKLARVVVATQDVPFGTALGPQNLRVVNWPAQSIPAGAFDAVEKLTAARRVTLRPIVAGEPVLASKISGSDGRATLSANLPVGKLAYAIPINESSGVGGFVRPGDVVDIILTRPIPGDGAGANDKMTDVIVQGAPVLGIDQGADATETKPAVAKTATLEVDKLQAQKLALAIQLGQLSLALRNVADASRDVAPTVMPRQLSTSPIYMPRRMVSDSARIAPARVYRPVTVQPVAKGAARPSGLVMTVVRGSAPSQYEVQRGF